MMLKWFLGHAQGKPTLLTRWRSLSRDQSAGSRRDMRYPLVILSMDARQSSSKSLRHCNDPTERYQMLMALMVP